MDMILKIDNTGKITMPKVFIAPLNLKENDSVNISTDSSKQRIIICKEIPACFFCGVTMDLIQMSGKYICSDCRDRLVNAAVGDVLY